MSHYKSDLRDIEFNMFEASDLGEHLRAGRFADFDEDSVREFAASLFGADAEQVRALQRGYTAIE